MTSIIYFRLSILAGLSLVQSRNWLKGEVLNVDCNVLVQESTNLVWFAARDYRLQRVGNALANGAAVLFVANENPLPIAGERVELQIGRRIPILMVRRVLHVPHEALMVVKLEFSLVTDVAVPCAHVYLTIPLVRVKRYHVAYPVFHVDEEQHGRDAVLREADVGLYVIVHVGGID